MNSFRTLLLLAKYNLKIVFGGKYLIFIAISLLFFCYFMFMSAYSGSQLSEETVYNQIIFPALLLIFYPTVYGLQKDEESKILEILFCIPNYMYKVWLLRLAFVFLECFATLILFSCFAHLLLCPIDIFKMAWQVMFVVFFSGSLAFYLSTAIKGGNGTAVAFIFIMAILMIIGSSFDTSMWNILINPFKEENYIHPAVWEATLTNNRLLLTISSFGLLTLSLGNLQRREKLL